jgi:uncharacterized protein YoxC
VTDKRTVPPRTADPFDAMIAALRGISVAVRILKEEVNTMTEKMSEKIEVQAGRIDGLSRASSELAKEVRDFGKSKERLMGRVATLELLQNEDNGHA